MLELVKGDKAVVIGKRYNPQLGVYLTGPYVVDVVRVNKSSIKVAYNVYEQGWYPTLFSSSGFAKKNPECVYGSISYSLYTSEEAIKEFNYYASTKGRDDYLKKVEFLQKEFAA